MRSIYLISLSAVLAGPAMAQSLLEPSSSATQMQPGNSASINQNIGAMVTLRNLNSVTEALSAQQKRPGSDARSTDTVDDGASYAVGQGLRDDMATLNATNSRLNQGKQDTARSDQDSLDRVSSPYSASIDRLTGGGKSPAGRPAGPDLASLQRKANHVEVFLNALTQQQRQAFLSRADQSARNQDAPPAIDPTAGVDPGSLDGNLTRAELVTAIVRQFGNQSNGKNPPASGGGSFTDTRPSSNWEAGYVNVGKSPDARGNSNPQPLDPTAGLDPETSAGKAPGNLNAMLANIREAMAQLNGLNQQTDTSKLSREEQALARLPRDVQAWVRMGLLTMEDAIGVAQAMQTEPQPERLPSKQPLDTANIVQTFVQTASIANAMSAGSTGPGRNAVTYMSAILQQGLTETGTEYASAEQTEAAANPWSDFTYYSAGQVTPIKPDQSLAGTTEGTYNGRVLGAFGNGDMIRGTLSLTVAFDHHADIEGNIAFTGGGGVSVSGNVTGTGISGTMTGSNVFGTGDAVTGALTGQMFGPRAEEIGGNWNLSVTGGSRNGQSAGGAFAGKQ